MRPTSATTRHSTGGSNAQPPRGAQRGSESSKAAVAKNQVTKKSARKESATAKREAALREALQQVFGEPSVAVAASSASGKRAKGTRPRGLAVSAVEESHEAREKPARHSGVAVRDGDSEVAGNGSTHEDNDNDASVDSYGSGSPTDRLQFGYAPALPDEAIAYHSMMSARDWIAARRKNGLVALVKKAKLHTLNCEPFASVLKLRRYWSRMNERLGDRLLRSGGGMTDDAADAFLDAMARAQGLAADELVVEAAPREEVAAKPRHRDETARERDERRRKIDQL